MLQTLRFSLAVLAIISAIDNVKAQTWNGSTDALWGTSANWSTNAVPTAAQTATFNGAGNGNTAIDLGGSAQVINSFLFDTAATAAYGFSGNAGDAFTLSAGGSITRNATVTNSQIFDTPLQFLGAYTITQSGATGGLTFNGGSSLATGGTAGLLTVTGAGNVTINGAIAAGAITGLTKSGAGTLNIGGQNLYTGTTTLALGTIQLVGGNDRLLPASTLAFTGATGALGLNANSQSLANITLPAGATGSYTIGGTGGTLNYTGALLQVGPGGALATNFVHTLNLTTLSNFTYNNNAGVIQVGLATGASNSVALGQVGTLTLAANNTITAATINVTTIGASNDAGIGTINFGTANTFNITNFNIGTTRGDANVQFAAGLTNPTITFRGLAGGTSNVTSLTLGNPSTFVTTQVTFTASANFSLGTIDGNFTTINVGNANAGASTNRVGVVNATFTQGSGIVNVTTLNLGLNAGTGTLGASTFTGNGTYTLNNAAGTLNATTINFATNTITATGTKSVSGTFNLTNGTLLATTVQLGAQTGTATVARTFNWTTGTISNRTGTNLVWNDIPVTLLTTATHTFDISGANTATLNAASIISGATFGITKTGTGTLVYNAANTYTGATTINGGTLQTNTGSTLGATTAPLTLGGGTLNLNATDQTVGTLSGTSGSIRNNGATASILTTTNAAASTFTGNIVDGTSTTGLTKAGAGTLTLNGANSYTGPTTINAGAINFATAFNTSTGLTLAPGANLSFTNGAGNHWANLTTLSLVSGTGNSIMNLQLDTPTTSDRFTSSGAAVVGGASNTLTLNFTALGGFGTGLYPLFTAASGLDGGLNYSLGTTPPGFGYNLITAPGGTSVSLDVFTITPTSGDIFWRGGINGKWNQNSGGNAVNFVTTNTIGAATMTGTPNITNTVNFSNLEATNAVTTLETNFTINDLVFNNEPLQGAVASIAPGVVPASTLTITPTTSTVGINVKTGAPATVAISAPVAIAAANQTWTVADALTSLTVSGGLTGSANITTAGLGSIFLNNVGTAYTGNITTGNSAVSFGGTVATTINGVISGTAAIIKAGTNVVTFGATNNSYTGSTTLSAGTLVVGSIADGGVNSGIGASTNAATNLIFNGGILSIAGALNSTNRNMTVDVGGGRILIGTEGSTLNLNGTLTGTGTFTLGALTSVLGGTSTMNLNGDSSAGFTGNFNHYTGNLVVKNANAFGSGTKTLEFVASTPSLMQLRLDGSGGEITLPAGFNLVVSATGANGIYSVAGNNTIAGNIAVTGGNGNASFYTAAVSGISLTLSGNISVLTGQTSRGITLGGLGNGLITGALTDNGTALFNVNKNPDAGIWTITGASNTYTGNTIVLGGTLRPGNDNAFSTTSRLFFGDQSANIGTFDLNGFNQQFNGLSAQSNNTTGATLNISAGKTLTITGATVANVVNIGSIATANASTTRLNVAGAGTLEVNDPTRNIVVAQLITLTGINSPSIFDLSALGTFNASVNNIYVGRPTAAAGTAATTSSAEAAQLLLANANSITAATNFVVGHMSFSSGVANSGLVRLGTTNAINTGLLVVGGGRVNGTVNFQTGLTNPSVTLRGAAGGTSRINITLGDQGNATGVGGTGGSNFTLGTLDFSAGTVDALIDTLIVGNGAVTGSSVRGQGNGLLTMTSATSIIDVNNLTIGRTFSDATATTNPGTASIGTVNINGGTFIVNTSAILANDTDITGGGTQNVVGSFNVAGGTATIGSVGTPVDVILGTHSNAGSTNPGLATANVTISGGTLTVNGNMVQGILGAGTIAANISLTGGALNLTVHNIGSATQPVTLITQTGTLSNVLEINGGATGISKTTAGTLTLAGVNSYTGPTTVSNGTLLVTGNNAAATGAVLVDGGTTGGTLRGTGTVGGAVTINGGTVPGTIRGGASIGTLSLASTLTINAGGQLFVELASGSQAGLLSTGGSTQGTPPNPTSNNYLNIAGNATIDAGTLIAVDGTGVSFTQLNYSYFVGKAANDLSALNITTASQFNFIGFGFTPNSPSLTGDASGNIYLNFANPIPEPAALGVIGLVAAALLRRRK